MPGIDADSTLERAGRRLASLSAIRGLWATVVGIALIVIAFVSAQGGAWFVPLLVIGLVLIAAGILGPRIRGRVSLEFGMGGATLDVQLHIAPPGQVGRLPRRGAAAAATAVVAPEAAVPGAEAQTSDEPTVIAEAVPAVDASPLALADVAPVAPPARPAAVNGVHHDPAQSAVRAARAAEAVAAVVAAHSVSNGNGNGNGHAAVVAEPEADQPAAEPDRS
jgi:hypothetical protein